MGINGTLMLTCGLLALGLGACATRPTEEMRQVEGMQRLHAMLEQLPPPPAPSTDTRASLAGHICWIDRVEAEGAGVRIGFATSAPRAIARADVHLDPGGTISPANSEHDGCTVTASRRGNILGVIAEAHFLARESTTPETRREWIAVQGE